MIECVFVIFLPSLKLQPSSIDNTAQQIQEPSNRQWKTLVQRVKQQLLRHVHQQSYFVMFISRVASMFRGLRSCHCQCSNASPGFRTNVNTLLDSLTKNAPLHDGFYEASVGHAPDQAFGILHCKANISKNDCAKCFRYPFGTVDGCPKNEKETLATSCTMKFSYKNFSGSWSINTIASFGGNGLDDPLVYSKGFSMMEELAGTVSDQPLMYQMAEIDVGVNGKRYGLAQCGRDLSKLSCQNCLEKRLDSCRDYTMNRTGWEIVGVGCSMWYSSNITLALTPPTSSEHPPNAISGVRRSHGGIGITTIISVTFAGILATKVLLFS